MDHEILIRTGKSSHDSMTEIGGLLGIRFEQDRRRGDGDIYVADTDDGAIAVLPNVYEDDGDLPLSKYDVRVEVFTGWKTEEGPTREAFERLKSLGYPMLWIADCLVEFDRFDPPAS